MRPFSRWMPPASREPVGLVGWLLLGGLLAAVVAAAVAWPVMRFILCLVTVFCLVATYARRRRLRYLADLRMGEDIGTFARAFDWRSEPFDPWVLRATWEALQPYVTFRGGQLPLRLGDRLDEDLCIDPYDIDYLLQEVAERSGHSLDQTASNPFYGHVHTVGDFVRFITYQPRAEVGIAPRRRS